MSVSSFEKTTYQWDPWGRLTQVTCPDYTWEATYDSFGRRLKTTLTPSWGFSQHTISYYDPEHEFLEVGLQSGQNTFWKIYGPSSCELILDNNRNAVGLLNNALGNLIAVITTNDISWKEEIPSAYGPLVQAEMPSSLLTYAQSLSWQGKQKDPTNLIWLGARYYNPTTGRFLSPDPIGYPISLNLYSYTNGDPVNFHDPDGRFESPVYDSSPATNISIGFLHGLAEMATDNIQFMHYVNGIASGGNLSEVDRVYSYHRNSLESYVTNQFSIDPQDSYYQNSRTVARWAANIFAVAKVGFSLGKMAILQGPAIIRSGFATVRSLFSEIKLVKEANFVRSGAENVNAGISLSKKLSQLEEAQQTAVKTRLLSDGRIRYYGSEKLASSSGSTRGRSFVTELETSTGKPRTWMECYETSGRVNRVHPKQINGQELVSQRYPPTAREL